MCLKLHLHPPLLQDSLGDKRGELWRWGGHTFEVSEWRSYHTLLLKIRLHPLQLCKKSLPSENSVSTPILAIQVSPHSEMDIRPA